MKPGLLTLPRSVLALTLLSGCSWLGDVSSNMRVDTGLEPQNIDSNVRYRTTYYFRVLTGCRIDITDTWDRADDGTPFVKRVKGEFVPLNDSLYRFRMTGQAAALFNRVHFESGVLRKEQIDPFGSTVRYNEDTNAFSPGSADEARADATRHAMMLEIRQYRTLYRDLVADDTLEANHRAQLFTKLIIMIEDRLDQIKASRPQYETVQGPSSGMAGMSPTETALTKLEQKLRDTEVKLVQASTELGDSQNKLREAQKKVVEIKTNLSDVKTALASPDPLTDKPKQNIDTLTDELAAAEKVLASAETNQGVAEKHVEDLIKEFTTVKTTIGTAHQNLTTAKQQTTTSLTTLKAKVEDLLSELGVAATTPSANTRVATCGGKPSENKYYLLGPEGAKELDPNDRLLLALSVDSKPLISALQQLSARKFQSAGGNLKVLEDLLEERGRILDFRSILQKAEKDAGQESTGPDQAKLRNLLIELRKSYVTTNVAVPAK